MLNSISNPKNLSLLLIALTVLFILPVNSAYADWSELDKLLASDGAEYDNFGNSVSVSGDYAIVGAWGHDDNGYDSGSAYIFKRDGTSWSEQAKLTASDRAADDRFGYSVSISGDYAIVGAHADDSYTGSAYIFEKPVGGWVNANETAKLTASDGAAGHTFGYSVSISGAYAIVGARGDDSYTGSAYLFKRDGTSWSEQAKLLASDGAAHDWFGHSVSISGDYAIVGATYGDGIVIASGSAYIFEKPVGGWVNANEIAKLTASDGAAGDYFGFSVSVSGDYAVVGAAVAESYTGSAYIFKRSGTSWSEQAKLLASDGAEYDYFGESVSVSGDYAVVGAAGAESYTGSAYIFKRSGTSWSKQAKLLASDGAADDRFGGSVSVSGDYAIVGAYCDDSHTGSAYMYIHLLEPEPEIHGIKWHDIDGDGRFVEDTDEGERGMPGWRIYIDENENGQFDAGEPNDLTDVNGKYVLEVDVGTYLVAEEVRPCWEQTCPGGDGTYSVTLEAGEIVTSYNFGSARPTEIHPSVWQREEQDKLLASDASAGDIFGWSVSVSGAYAIVGAWGDDSYTGSAYIFALSDVNCSDWDEAAKLTASDGAAGDYFGISVSVSGAYAIVGAYLDDDASGSAYIFKRDGTSWSQQAKLVALDGAADDYFGVSVSISGNYAIVGASGDDSHTGSAYIFYYNGTSWILQTKLLASDGAADDRFGCSVSVSGVYAIVGAFRDDDKGSAYIFRRSGATWGQQEKLLAAYGAADDKFGCSVSISGDYAIVGAYLDDDIYGTDSGSAYIFKRYGMSWSQQAKLRASDGYADDWFGWSVSISGDYAIVGAIRDDDNGSGSGSAYIFERDCTSWSEQAKWGASDGAAGDWFGFSVSSSGDYAIVGANYDGDNGLYSGSAYMFGKILCPSADLTGDCFVDFKDFAEVAGQWLQGAE